MLSRRTVYLIVLATIIAGLHGLIIGKDAWLSAEEGAVSPAQLLEMQEILWVDARSPADFRKRHHPGAIHLTEDKWDEGLANVLVDWDPDRPIVVYCDGNGCESSRMVALRLRKELGVKTIYWLDGGWIALQTEGLEP